MTDPHLPTSEEAKETVATIWRIGRDLYRGYQSVVRWLGLGQKDAPPAEDGEGDAPSNEPEAEEPSPNLEKPGAKEEVPGILIIGPGGTGKTTLARLLAGIRHTNPLELPGDYVESMTIENYTMTDPPAEIVVPPGQTRHRERDWGQLLDEIARGGYRGVILVVANGYHGLGINHKQHKLYPSLKKKTPAEFLKTYCEAQRRDELGVLEKIAPHIRQCPGKLWLLTVVTKEDLWDGKASVDHYRDDARGFGRIVRELTNHLGVRHFRADVVPVSLVISNFTTPPSGEVLAKNLAGYDQVRQAKSLQGLFKALDAFRAWEAE